MDFFEEQQTGCFEKLLHWSPGKQKEREEIGNNMAS